MFIIWSYENNVLLNLLTPGNLTNLFEENFILYFVLVVKHKLINELKYWHHFGYGKGGKPWVVVALKSIILQILNCQNSIFSDFLLSYRSSC